MDAQPTAQSTTQSFPPVHCPPAHVVVTDTTIWFTQAQLASLHHVTKQTINYHLRALQRSGVLNLGNAVSFVSPSTGRRTIHYSLDIALALGNRLRTYVGAACAYALWCNIQETYPHLFPRPNAL